MSCIRRNRRPKNDRVNPRGFGHGPWGGAGILPWGGSVPLVKFTDGLYVVGYKALFSYEGPPTPAGVKAQITPEFYVHGYKALYSYEGPASPVGFKAKRVP
jgi:hypothetical protein